MVCCGHEEVATAAPPEQKALLAVGEAVGLGVDCVEPQWQRVLALAIRGPQTVHLQQVETDGESDEGEFVSLYSSCTPT